MRSARDGLVWHGGLDLATLAFSEGVAGILLVPPVHAAAR
jgi:hypothetical protein